MRDPRTVLTLGLALTLAGTLAGCSSATGVPDGPTYDPPGQGKCKVQVSQTKPLIVEWPSAARGELEVAASEGMVVVRYDGCEMELLTRCKTEGKYRYSAYTPKKDSVIIKTADELYANLPMGAVKLEATLAQAGELGVSMTMVGRYLAERESLSIDDVQGACDGATHVVVGLTVGAFEFFAASQAEVGGGVEVASAGAKGGSRAARETLSQDGKVAACDQSSREDTAPPSDCAAIMRVEVVPLGASEKVKAAAGPKPADDMVRVPAGEFVMGCDDKLSPPDSKLGGCGYGSQPAHRVYLDAFDIDRTEVTRAQYLRCIQAGQCSAERSVGEEDNPIEPQCSLRFPDRDDHPMNCLSWDQAQAYCRWVGKRLPTEAEWEKAAQGGKRRRFPWGNQDPTCKLAVTGLGHGHEDEVQGCGRNSTWPVGSKPAGASPNGLLDMAGNVAEWVADWYLEDYYARSPQRNPKGPASGGEWGARVARGGGWATEVVGTTGRRAYEGGGSSIGFRCARSVR